jgi:Fic family protein
MNKPPYTITNVILNEIAACSELIGKIQAYPAKAVSPKLRRQNRIKSIFGSLKIEGNSLDLDQMTAILDQRRVQGPVKDIREVENALKAYETMDKWDIHSEPDFLAAHKQMMKGVLDNAGRYRTSQVGVLTGNKVAHVGPGYKLVPKLMGNLFQYLRNSKEENSLIVGSVFHYELEFIHPFLDGNGRMGRLWQNAIISSSFPIFRNIPIENAIRENQKEYYQALAASDKQGNSTVFIEFSLGIIRRALQEFHSVFGSEKESVDSRLEYALQELKGKSFSRKEYKTLFIGLSTATASRDLKKGVDEKRIVKTGDKRLTRYATKNRE